MQPEILELLERIEQSERRCRAMARRCRIFCSLALVVAVSAILLSSRPPATAHDPGHRRVVSNPGSQSGQTRSGKQPAKVITVRPPSDVANRQGLRQFVGISEATAGAKGLSMNLIVIPPGAAAKPHMHVGFESAVYVLKGRAETRYGEGLKQSVINKTGDFLFIPPDLPHQPRNLSSTEPVLAIVARNDPNEQEHVYPYNPTASQKAKP